MRLSRSCLVFAGLLTVVHSAGDAIPWLSGPDAHHLFLRDGEKAAGMGNVPGAGVVEEQLEADVVVAGGGSAGFGAVLAAARLGVKVILVHARKVLGGNASSESKLHFVGAAKQGHRSSSMDCEARETGIIEELLLKNSVANPQRCAELLDLTMLDMVRQEPNIKLLLNTEVVSAVKNANNTITTVTAYGSLDQRKYIIKGKIFVDSTGDGRLGAEAFAPFVIGREGKDVYNESLAMPQSDNATEGSSFAFTAKDMGRPMPFVAPSWARNFTLEDFKYRQPQTFDYGYWWVEIAYPYNTITDNNLIQQLLTANLLGVWNFFKNSGHYPGSANYSIDWFQWWPCKREARRFRGMYVQTQNDILPNPSDKTFPPKNYYDSVAYGGWNFDLHNPRGIYDTSRPPYNSTAIHYLYSTPLRSLIATNVTNLMLAGRLASFSQVVYGSQRVMKTGMVMGQAVGTAAAYCLKHGLSPTDLGKETPQTRNMLWSIQQQLLRDDAYVIGAKNEDPRDHARRATAEATSTSTNYPNATAVAALTGQGRCVDTCAAPGQFQPGPNRWMSHVVPASLDLKWQTPVPNLALVELTFDTGLHRALTLSQRASDQNGQYWGVPQPETVKDYTIEASSGGQWREVVRVESNYLRKRVHNVQGLGLTNVDALRVTVTATNGAPQVRIVEIRVYGNDGLQPFPEKPN